MYLSGFFRSAVQKKLVHISYYEQMGQTAYSRLGRFYESKQNVFNELACEFKSLSQTLFSLQKKFERQKPQHPLSLKPAKPLAKDIHLH